MTPPHVALTGADLTPPGYAQDKTPMDNPHAEVGIKPQLKPKVNKAELDVFLVFSCFFDVSTDVDNLISDSSAFSKSSLNIRKFMVCVLLKPGLYNLNITLLACEMTAIVQSFEHSLALPFFGIGMKTDLFQSCGYC